MYLSWRAVLHIFSAAAFVFVFPGCIEYNPHATVSEANSLSDIVQLTTGYDRAGEANFSRDMRWIAFRGVPLPGEHPRLYLAKVVSNPTGIAGIERPICITAAEAHSVSAAFSPDGLSVIFASNSNVAADAPNRPKQPRIFRVDGWEGAVAMADASVGIDLAQHPVLTDQAESNECSYSPDGRWICFTSGSKGTQCICVMHADGTHLVLLSKPTDDDAQATFSPDGKSLVYRSRRGGGQLSQIYLADLVFDQGGEITGITAEQALTHDQNSNANPAWHPDGQHIIYTTSRHGRDNYELYLMNRQGERKTRITFSPGADLLPVFSADGQYLMWTSQRSAESTDQVFVAKFQFPRGS